MQNRQKEKPHEGNLISLLKIKREQKRTGNPNE